MTTQEHNKLTGLIRGLFNFPGATALVGAIVILLAIFVQGIQIFPTFEFSFRAILTGLALVALITYFARRYRQSQRPAVGGGAPQPVAVSAEKKLTRIVKRLLDGAWYLFAGIAILWPVAALGVGSGFLSDSGSWYVDVFLGFKIFPEMLNEAATESASAVDAVIRGQSKLQIKTPSQFAWYMAAAISEGLLVIFLYGLAQTRALFASLVGGKALTLENAGRIRTIGLVLIGWNVVAPLLQYFGGRAMLADIALNVPGIEFYPSTELDVGVLFLGLAIVVLSGVMREAADLHQEQSLTI